MTNQKDKISELEHKLDALEKKYKVHNELLRELIYFFMKEVGAGQNQEHRHTIIPEFLVDSFNPFIRRLDPKNRQTNDKELWLEILEKLKKYAERDDKDNDKIDLLLKSCMDQLNTYYNYIIKLNELKESGAEYDILDEFENAITLTLPSKKLWSVYSFVRDKKILKRSNFIAKMDESYQEGLEKKSKQIEEQEKKKKKMKKNKVIDAFHPSDDVSKEELKRIGDDSDIDWDKVREA